MCINKKQEQKATQQLCQIAYFGKKRNQIKVLYHYKIQPTIDSSFISHCILHVYTDDKLLSNAVNIKKDKYKIILL